MFVECGADANSFPSAVINTKKATNEAKTCRLFDGKLSEFILAQ